MYGFRTVENVLPAPPPCNRHRHNEPRVRAVRRLRGVHLPHSSRRLTLADSLTDRLAHSVNLSVPVDHRPPELEHRFLVEGGEARGFLERVSPHVTRDIYDRDRPIAYVRTTYFDS